MWRMDEMCADCDLIRHGARWNVQGVLFSTYSCDMFLESSCGRLKEDGVADAGLCGIGMHFLCRDYREETENDFIQRII
jgi:hypothetical protein